MTNETPSASHRHMTAGRAGEVIGGQTQKACQESWSNGSGVADW